MKKLFCFAFISILFIHFQSCKTEDDMVIEEPDIVVDNPEEPDNTEESDTIEEPDSLTINWQLPEELFDYTPNIPDFAFDNFISDLSAVYIGDNVLEDFVLSNEMATLGRVLFYDPRLSIDNTVSCGSCHQQENAFSSSEQFSTGIFGQKTTRNSMSLANHRWSRNFFWDTRENFLEDQILQPIVHPEEMGSDLEQLVKELETVLGYNELFEDAFGSPEISSTKISAAIAHFIRAMVSFNSKYDIGSTMDFENFTDSELAGKNLFFDGNGLTACNHCHVGQTFLRSNDPRNNGLSENIEDLGRFEITGNESDKGKFKTVTLRNIGVTAPYMHDGRFETLEEVIQFYNSDIQAHPNLDDRLTVETQTGGTPVQMNLSEQDIADLVAFLRTLTDETFINDERFSDPF